MTWISVLGLVLLGMALFATAWATLKAWVKRATVFAFVVFAVRFLLVTQGYVHDTGPVRLLDLMSQPHFCW